MKGMLVHVYRSSLGDCTNGGVTAKHDKFVLVGEGVPEIFEPSEDSPALRLVKRNFGGKPYYHAEPIDQPQGMCGPMAGGNLIGSSDSRLSFLGQAISVHDRFETWEQYERMSI